MRKFHKGLAPLIIVLLVALGLVGGTTAGYTLREPIKKAISGSNTAEEIQKAIEAFKFSQNKFELEGIVTSIDSTNKIVTVNIKSSTSSIKELRLSATPIALTESTAISSASLSGLKITDIPIDSQIHVAGLINDSKLTASRVIIQKDEAGSILGDRFSVGGTVQEVGVGELKIDVKTANSKMKDKKGTTVTIKTDSTTFIEKSGLAILLTDIKVGNEVQVTGALNQSEYLANRIEVKIKEQAGELELEQNINQNQGSTQNKETEQETNKNINGNSSSNSNAGGNSIKNQ